MLFYVQMLELPERAQISHLLSRMLVTQHDVVYEPFISLHCLRRTGADRSLGSPLKDLIKH
jgi:hypothetical protein